MADLPPPPEHSALPPPPEPVDPKAAKKAAREAKKAERKARYEAAEAERKAKYKARMTEIDAEYHAKKVARDARYEADKAERKAKYEAGRAVRKAKKAARDAEYEAKEAELQKRSDAIKAERAARNAVNTERDAELAELAERNEAAQAANTRAQAEKDLAKKPRYLKDSASGFGITVKDGEVRHKRDRGSLVGLSARVETAGEIRSRFTVTRLALLGTYGLALKKKKDKRELYITVEGAGFAFVVELDPDKGKKARQFAAELTALGSKAAVEEAERAAKARLLG